MTHQFNLLPVQQMVELDIQIVLIGQNRVDDFAPIAVHVCRYSLVVIHRI